MQTDLKGWPGSIARILREVSMRSCLRVNRRDGSVLARVPAGAFEMGEGKGSDEPKHRVELGEYWIGVYAVTNGQYAAFLEATGKSPASPSSSASSHPVVNVSWDDARAYCRWAGGDLPTEAQWEKASRWTGSYPNVYPWGNAWDAENCNNWYDHNAAGGGYQRYQTAPVGSYPSGASPYGLQDMAGNVWEWCRDWYSSSYYSVSPSTDPQGPSSGSCRVLRGGSWNYYLNRCAARGSASPDYWVDDAGFRLVRSGG